MTDADLDRLEADLEKDWPGAGWEESIRALLAEVRRRGAVIAACDDAIKTEWLYQTGQLPGRAPKSRSVCVELHDAMAAVAPFRSKP